MDPGIVNGSILFVVIVLFALLWMAKITSKERDDVAKIYRKKRNYRIGVLLLSVLAFVLFYFFDARAVAFLCMICAGFFYIRAMCLSSPSAVKAAREQQEKSDREKTLSQ